jgi:NTE family protein
MKALRMTSAIRKKNALNLSPAEVAKIGAKFPKASDGKIYIDAVFEGGGVRGLAFLGALRALDDAGIKVRKVAGTSAGAITAAIVASGMEQNAVEANVFGMNFMDLLTKKTKRGLIFNNDPSDDMDNIGLMLANLAVVGAMGQYKTDPLKDWMTGVLKGRLDTFGDIKAGPAWHEKRELKVVISDISAGEMRCCPTDLALYGVAPSKFSVAEAVRLSMSIPLFFEPGTLGGNTIIDGGVLSSFPLSTFDCPIGVVPNCPTLGFRLSPPSQTPKKVTSAIGVVGAMLQTMLVAHDRRYARLHDQHRIVDLTSSEISITKFSLTDADKETLYVRGYKETKAFLLNEWSWDRYLADRAVPPQ